LRGFAGVGAETVARRPGERDGGLNLGAALGDDGGGRAARKKEEAGEESETMMTHAEEMEREEDLFESFFSRLLFRAAPQQGPRSRLRSRSRSEWD